VSTHALKRGFAAVVLVVLTSSCQRERSASDAPSMAIKPAPAPAQQALDRIDGRTPLPLLPMMAAHQKQNMREHLQAVQAMTASLAVGDFAGVKHAAERLGSSQQMTRMCEHMGAHTPGFTETALSFHETADTIGAAAEHQDRDAVLAALTRTLAACTSCHATYKQQVIDEAAWAALPAPTR
jgi:hypothetical protein